MTNTTNVITGANAIGTKKQRDYYYDNVKFFLIILVVATHTFSPVMGESWFLERLFYFIYTFHMPAFIIICGHFMKYIKNLNKYVFKYTKYYVVMQTVYFIVMKYLLGQKMNLTYSMPYYTYWFMLSLVAWYVIFPYVKDIKWILLISILVGITVGYDRDFGLSMSLSRTVVYFPYFLLGYFLKRDHISTLKEIKWKYAIWALCVLLVFVLLNYDLIPRPLLQGKSSYAMVGLDMWYAGAYRLTLYGISTLISIGFFILIPEGEKFYSKLGSQTLYVYLAHGLILKILQYNGLYEIFSGIALVFIGALLGLFLSISIFIIRSSYNKYKY
ncbi:hypothetical protein GC105_00580 [Alkalibaculum sp. M08DMB]|uniref:Acyltransferase 3 domain-containing protein n=1 Tax=Alkalibaculum sporogenes TaxID=2655001 RepID=A0A6A7K4I5_9FIRM|nr:acyltransferase family protein [Alkalibaculum sporogenes]MPW24290.1 hypothetical protein [Alkalibaculum sporogenes]